MQRVTDIQLEVCSRLDRFDIDAVQYSTRTLRRVVDNNAHRWPLRRLRLAQVQVGRATSVEARNGRRLQFSGTYVDEIRFVLHAIHQSKLGDLEIGPSQPGTLEELSEEIAQIFIERTATVRLNCLFLWNVTLEKLRPTTFRDFFLGFAKVGLVWIPSRGIHSVRKTFDPSQVSDLFLRECGSKGIDFSITLSEGFYVAGHNPCAATDAGILDYCFNTNNPCSSRVLKIRNFRQSRNFFHALIERSIEATKIEAISLEVFSHIPLHSLDTSLDRYGFLLPSIFIKLLYDFALGNHGVDIQQNYSGTKTQRKDTNPTRNDAGGAALARPLRLGRQADHNEVPAPLVENKQMPLRKVDRVGYHGDPDPTNNRSTLTILLAEDEKDGHNEVELQIDAAKENATDLQKVASYLASCFICDFSIYRHLPAPPRNAIIAAPALIDELAFRNCSFANGEEDTLSNTLRGSTFRCLELVASSVPAWQIDDKRLESLRLSSCNKLYVSFYEVEPYDDDRKFKVTEEGILRYCFTLDDDLPMPERRYLGITWVNVTPAFFKKVVEFDVGNLDVGVLPSRWLDYDRFAWSEYMHHVRYNIADHGNGIKLLIYFRSEDGYAWNAIVRHGKKDREEFFEPKPSEDKPNEEYLGRDRQLDDHDFFDDN